MSLLGYEQSQREGAARELFLFKSPLESVGTGFTNSDQDVTFGIETYSSIAIGRTEPEYSTELDKSSIEIVCSKETQFFRRYIQIAAADRYRVSVFRGHIGQSPEWSLFWKGFVSQVVFEGNQIRVLCKSLLDLTSRLGPRMTYQQPCNHVLYDERCQLSNNPYKAVASPASVSADGVTFTFTNINIGAPVTAAPSGYQGNYWVGGYMVTPDNVDYRLIVAQQGNSTIVVQYPFLESTLGKNMTLYAGCDHQATTCRDKFNNVINYGGHLYLPDRNVFTKGF